MPPSAGTLGVQMGVTIETFPNETHLEMLLKGNVSVGSMYFAHGPLLARMFQNTTRG